MNTVLKFQPDQVKMKRLPFDLRAAGDPWEARRAAGKALRTRVPRESHAEWKPPKGRPSPLDLIAQSNVGRQPDFVPLRMGRMALSPFTFLRGSAVVMACGPFPYTNHRDPCGHGW